MNSQKRNKPTIILLISSIFVYKIIFFILKKINCPVKNVLMDKLQSPQTDWKPAFTLKIQTVSVPQPNTKYLINFTIIFKRN